jgi:hypothetical protein
MTCPPSRSIQGNDCGTYWTFFLSVPATSALGCSMRGCDWILFCPRRVIFGMNRCSNAREPLVTQNFVLEIQEKFVISSSEIIWLIRLFGTSKEIWLVRVSQPDADLKACQRADGSRCGYRRNIYE